MTMTRRLLAALLLVGAAPGLPGIATAAEPLLLGIVSISANEANNARFIKGATEAATAKGWQVSVIDAAGSADKANAAMQNLVQRQAGALIDMVFPVTSLGAGLKAARDAKVPVATWGGGLGGGVVATNGSGGPLAEPIAAMLVEGLGGPGNVLALTYHTGEVCRQREEVFDGIVAKAAGVDVTKNEVRIPGYFQDGAQFAVAFLAANPAGSGPLAIWGCWDDPAVGAISTLRQQGRTDVKVYGQNGNAQALDAVKRGVMTATAWQDSYSEGKGLVAVLAEAMAAGDAWTPKAVEVPAVVVTSATVDAFLQAHPEAAGK